MTFVTAGLAIAGGLAIAIPILIHLLARQRRKPIEWAAMRFLIEAFRKHKRRLQLEQLILLAIRCLIVGLLGLALARPILEGSDLIAAGGTRAVYLVMDDGMVSGVTGEDGKPALQRHVRQAVELVNALGPGDSVGVITAARPAQALLMPPSTDHGAVVNLLQSLTPKESPTDLAGAFGFVRGAADDSRKSQQPALVYLFSDFRGGSAPLDSPLPPVHADAGETINLLASAPAEQPISNVQIVSIEPVRSLILPGANDGSGQVTVRLARSGGQLAGDVTRVNLTGEGLPLVEPKVVNWQPGQSQSDVKFMVNFAGSSDRAAGLTAVIDDDALNMDNQRHAVLEIRSHIRVLIIDRRSFGFEKTLDQLSAGQWVRRALEPRETSPIQVVEVEPAALDLPDVRTADVAVLPRPDLLTNTGWAALQHFVQHEGLLIVMPPGDVNVHQWTERLSQDLRLPWRLGLEATRYAEGLGLAEDQPSSELLRLISSDLGELARPVLAYRQLAVDREQTHAQPLLVFADGSPMVIAGSPTDGEHAEHSEAEIAAAPVRGMVVYLSVAPELSWTNLPSKPLMVPLFHEIIRQGLSVIRAAQQLQVGETASLTSGPVARDLIGPQGQRIALDTSGRPQKPLDHAGVYSVVDPSDHPIGKLAVNIDSAAGTTDVQSASAVSAWLGASGPWKTFDANNVGASLSVDHARSPIAGLLLMIVLGLVIAEAVLARRFSHAYREEAFGSRLSALGAPVVAERRQPRAESQS